MTARPDIAATMAQVARELSTPRHLDAALDSIIYAARASLPGVNHVGVSLSHRDGKVETVAATDQLVWDLDNLQHELGEGPCLDAIWQTPVVRVDNARHDQRWPRYIPRAVERGVRSQLALRLYADDDTIGGLNLFSTETDSIPAEVQEAAELFATHAALALGRVRHEEDLNSALLTRKVIGQAVGIVMERYALNEERAFQYLARVSQQSNVKLRDVAAELVQLANEKASG